MERKNNENFFDNLLTKQTGYYTICTNRKSIYIS